VRVVKALHADHQSSELKSETDTCYFDDFDKPGACNAMLGATAAVALLIFVQEQSAANRTKKAKILSS
jgi:hypothetical protein